MSNWIFPVTNWIMAIFFKKHGISNIYTKNNLFQVIVSDIEGCHGALWIFHVSCLTLVLFHRWLPQIDQSLIITSALDSFAGFKTFIILNSHLIRLNTEHSSSSWTRFCWLDMLPKSSFFEQNPTFFSMRLKMMETHKVNEINSFNFYSKLSWRYFWPEQPVINFILQAIHSCYVLVWTVFTWLMKKLFEKSHSTNS